MGLTTAALGRNRPDSDWPIPAQSGISDRLSFLMMCPPNRREVQRHTEQQSEAPSLPLTADSVGTSCET